MKKITLCAFGVLVLGTLFMSGCDSAAGSEDGEGRLVLKLTDAPFPFDLVAEANVTISRIDIVGGADVAAPTDSSAADRTGEEGVITILQEERSFNLLELRDGVTATLSDIVLPEGQYTQLRLIVDSASVVMNEGTKYKLTIPSGAQTGIKVLLPDFEVQKDVQTELTLDFDVSESFVVQGNPSTAGGIKGFLFKPVIKPLGLPVAEADSVSGS